MDADNCPEHCGTIRSRVIQRIVYFLFGAVFACVMGILLLVWDASHDFRFGLRLIQEASRIVEPEKTKMLSAEELLGKWHGKDGWGATYTITRQRDGTFSEVMELREAPRIVKSKGRWSINGAQYAYCYTQSTDSSRINRGPWVITIKVHSPTGFGYFADEGNWATEWKE